MFHLRIWKSMTVTSLLMLCVTLSASSGNYQHQQQQQRPNAIPPLPQPAPPSVPWSPAPSSYSPPAQPTYPTLNANPTSAYAAEFQRQAGALQLQQQQQQGQQQQQRQPLAAYQRQTAPAYVPIQQAYTVAYYPTYQPSSPPPPTGPYVPAPPGQKPYCAKEGQTYCEDIDYYPTKIVLHLLENTDLENFLVNEGEADELRPLGYYNITPTYFYDYSYTTNTNGRQPGAGAGPPAPNDYFRPQRRIRRQLGDDDDMCPTNKKVTTAKAAQNARGNWKYVVNLPEVDKKLTQAVETESCRSSQCRGLCTPPSGSSSRCEQQYINTRLISLDPSGEKFNNEVFKFPHGCICKITPPI